MLEMSKDMSNAAIARLLRQVAAAFEVKDEDFFRTKAYQNAAASIEHATSTIKDIWEGGKLDDIPGVGSNLAQHLDELFRTGRVRHFDNEVKGLPPGMFAIMGLPQVGPKTAYKLAKELKLNDPKTAKKILLDAAKKGKIHLIEGFGEDSERQLLVSLEADEVKSKIKSRLLLPQAETLASEVTDFLKGIPEVIECEVLGSHRRRCATIGDADLAVKTNNPEAVMIRLKEFPKIKKILATGLKTTMFIHSSGRQVDVKTQTPNRWGSMLQHYTGSKLHNISLRKYAIEKGMSLSENGIKYQGKLHTFKTEESFYRFLGLEYIPPEIREDTGEIEMAKKHQLPHLVEFPDILGDIHIHTSIKIQTSHDEGDSSVKEILEKAINLGYHYVGLADHNPKLHGLNTRQRIDLIKRRNDKIDQEVSSFKKTTSKRVPFVFKGLEIDIRTDGELALEDEALELLDYAIVSIHSSFNQERDTATRRVLRALDHPKARVLGHPTGRMLESREGLDFDWQKVFEFCVKNHKLIEINASPERLDLPDLLVREATNKGVMLVINTDSHEKDSLDFMRYGVDVARRGWSQKKDIANSFTLEKFKKVLTLS